MGIPRPFKRRGKGVPKKYSKELETKLKTLVLSKTIFGMDRKKACTEVAEKLNMNYHTVYYLVFERRSNPNPVS